MPSYAGFQTIDLNMAERFIELRSYDRRYRLVAVDRLAEGGPVPAEKPANNKPNAGKSDAVP